MPLRVSLQNWTLPVRKADKPVMEALGLNRQALNDGLQRCLDKDIALKACADVQSGSKQIAHSPQSSSCSSGVEYTGTGAIWQTAFQHVMGLLASDDPNKIDILFTR